MRDFFTDLCETEDFASQARGLVHLCRDAGLTIAEELGAVLNSTTNLVPRLRLVQVHNQEGELRSGGIQSRHRSSNNNYNSFFPRFKAFWGFTPDPGTLTKEFSFGKKR